MSQIFLHPPGLSICVVWCVLSSHCVKIRKLTSLQTTALFSAAPNLILDSLPCLLHEVLPCHSSCIYLPSLPQLLKVWSCIMVISCLDYCDHLLCHFLFAPLSARTRKETDLLVLLFVHSVFVFTLRVWSTSSMLQYLGYPQCRGMNGYIEKQNKM